MPGEGGGFGWGCAARRIGGGRRRRDRLRRLFGKRSAPTPIPDPSPLEGEGRVEPFQAIPAVILGPDPRIGGLTGRSGLPAICDGRLDPRVKPEGDGEKVAREAQYSRTLTGGGASGAARATPLCPLCPSLCSL